MSRRAGSSTIRSAQNRSSDRLVPIQDREEETVYHHSDPATVLRHRAAETERLLIAQHRRAQQAERTSAPRSATQRALAHLRWT